MSNFIGTSFPDCSKCSKAGGESVRERWGCDTVAANPVFFTSCSCGGSESCDKCGGSNEKPHYQCPSNVIGGAGFGAVRDVDRMMRVYIQYDQRRVLPTSGGWFDQSASFANCVELIDAERGWWERKRQEKIDRDRKAQELRAQQGRR